MATSTRLAIPYPEAADTPPDVPAWMLSMATRLDNLVHRPLTTAARDALTGTDLYTGRMIFNTTTEQLETYDGTAWVGGSATSFSGVRAFRATVQSIPDATFTALEWTDETFDVGGWHDNVTNNNRFTVPAGVAYIEVAVHATLGSAGTGYREVAIRKNGSTVALATFPPTNGAPSTIQSSTKMPVVAGDWVDVMVRQNSGGALNTRTSSAEHFIEVTSLGAA